MTAKGVRKDRKRVRRLTVSEVRAQLRQQEALRMRTEGYTFEQIAQACGYANRGGAERAVKAELARRGDPHVAEHRAIASERYERLLEAVMPAALAVGWYPEVTVTVEEEDGTHRHVTGIAVRNPLVHASQLDAVGHATRLIDRLVKLHGSAVPIPSKVELSLASGQDPEDPKVTLLRKLAEMGERQQKAVEQLAGILPPASLQQSARTVEPEIEDAIEVPDPETTPTPRGAQRR